MITISIVSHGHGTMLEPLLAQLARFPQVSKVIVTQNIPEALDHGARSRFVVQRNLRPLGFGANHNAAFRLCATPLFCILNPDIELSENPFPALLNGLEQNKASLAVPLVVTRSGEIDDTTRYFPTPLTLLRKAIYGADGRHPVPPNAECFQPDWAAGMFMLFRTPEFQAVNGFDEGFFLYYEDVDICIRLWRDGRRIVACPQAWVIHAAQRRSRRNLRYAAWHLQSMLRYFAKHLGRLPRTPHGWVQDHTSSLGEGNALFVHRSKRFFDEHRAEIPP